MYAVTHDRDDNELAPEAKLLMSHASSDECFLPPKILTLESVALLQPTVPSSAHEHGSSYCEFRQHPLVSSCLHLIIIFA